LALGIDDSHPEGSGDLCQGWLARNHQFPGHNVGVQDRNPQAAQVIRRLGFPRPDATSDAYGDHLPKKERWRIVILQRFKAIGF
jgi:hypothetical protein